MEGDERVTGDGKKEKLQREQGYRARRWHWQENEQLTWK